MLFRKYNSIENSYQKEFLQTLVMQGFGELEYVVQEKVHGANFSFITNGTEIAVAKRTELIGADENFFNWELILEKYRSNVLDLFQTISKEMPIETLTIFGELFGGGYPHPEVKRDKTAVLTQGGIFYHPSNDFYAFDICVDQKQFWDVDRAEQLCGQTGFIFAKTLFKGSLNECLAYPNEFPTTLPAIFGLPEIEGNVCEGVVIRPVVASYLHSGSRVLIKNKNEKWSEKNKSVDKSLLKRLVRDEPMSDEANFLREEIYKLINENRLLNVISKIGEVNPAKDSGKLLGLFNRDILADFMKDYKDRYEALEKSESKSINKFMNKHAAELIFEYFLK